MDNNNTKSDSIFPIFNLIHSLEDAGKSKELAKIGDPIINLAFSMAVSKIYQKFVGIKINKKIQAQALRDSGLRHCTILRPDAHDLADSTEAICAFAYYKLDFSIEYMAEVIYINMKEMPSKQTADKIKAAIWGLTALLISIKKYALDHNINCSNQ